MRTTWQETFRRVPRHRFIPDTVWVARDDGFMVPLHRADDPQRWQDLCDDPEEAIVTQVDDGAEDQGIWPTSSSSTPVIMMRMLDALDVDEGMRVLEIGTGTGYNAAVLAERIEAANVIAVEVDVTVADHARGALAAAGYPVTVVTGDGTFGHAKGAPYDRIIVTAAVTEIPYAWVEQTRPGGRIVAPWATAFHPEGALLTLTVADDGTAEGGFDGPAAFMYLRGQRPDLGTGGMDDSDCVDTTTRIYPRELLDGDFDATFAVGAQLPGCRHGHIVEDGVHTLNLSHLGSGSWASFTSGADRHEVRQRGPRRLWDEFASAYRLWVASGRPGHTRFGMTVTPGGQRIWLDSPDQVVSPVSARIGPTAVR